MTDADTAAAVPAASPWAFVREWWAVLSAVHSPSIEVLYLRSTLRLGYSRLHIWLPPSQDEDAATKWALTRDAVEIVLLHSIVDPHAFLSVMREYCHPHATFHADWREFVPDEDFEPPLTVELELSEADLARDGSVAWPETVLSVLFTPLPLSERTQRFRDTRSELLSHVATPQQEERLQEFNIPIQIALFMVPTKPALELIDCLASYKKNQRYWTEAAGSDQRTPLSEYPFRISKIDLLVMHEMLSAPLMKRFSKHVRNGNLPLGDITVCQSESSSLLARLPFAEFVTALCSPDGPPVIYQNPPCSGARTIRIESRLAFYPTTQLYSALTFSIGVEELVVEDMRSQSRVVDRRQRWAMLLYALFCADATNDIQTLVLHDFKLTEPDLEWMKELFEAHNPIERLLLYSLAENSRPDTFEIPPQRITVGEGARLGVFTGLQTIGTVQAVSPLTFYSFRRWLDGIEVIAPAFGNVKVPIEHVSSKKRLDPQVHKWWCLDSHGLRSLEIRATSLSDAARQQQRMQTLAEFVALIGRPLESISLVCTVAQAEPFFDTMLPACVGLKKLEAFLPNTEASSTSLMHTRPGSAQSVRSLADPTTQMSQTVEELSLSWDTSRETPTAQQYLAFAAALETNEKIRYISLSASPERFGMVEDRLKAYDNSWIPGLSARDLLPMPCKCAVISVVEHLNDPRRAKDGSPPCAAARFDSRVLAIVFEMAGTPKRRTVVLP